MWTFQQRKKVDLSSSVAGWMKSIVEDCNNKSTREGIPTRNDLGNVEMKTK
jgi:hypothetical protein